MANFIFKLSSVIFCKFCKHLISKENKIQNPELHINLYISIDSKYL